MSIITHSTIGNCAVLTMNRPAALNAITTDMLNLFESQLDAIEKDDSRAVILTGAGRAFCPGSDIKSPPDNVRARIDQVHRLIRRLLEFPKLSIAAINGLALGGGLELALACTFRVAASDAKLGLPEIKIGLMPAYGGTVLLPRLIGAGRAQEMMLGVSPYRDKPHYPWALSIACLKHQRQQCRPLMTSFSPIVISVRYRSGQFAMRYSLVPMPV